MFKRVLAAAGNPLSYAGYAIPLFVVYFLYDILVSDIGPLKGTTQTIASLAYGLLLSPLLLAGLYGAIHEQQKTHGETGVSEFFANAWRYYWRVTGVNFFCTLVEFVIAIAIGAALHWQMADAISRYVDIPFSAIILFWFASVVAEGGLFASLGRALRLLLGNPLALALGILWAVFRFAEDTLLGVSGIRSSLAWNGIDAALITGIRIIAAVYAVALYRQWRGEALEPKPPVAVQPDFFQPDMATQPDAFLSMPTVKPAPPDVAAAPEAALNQPVPHRALVNASLGFGLASFIPLVHFVALALGILAIIRNKRFFLRAGVAICLGAFFTGLYALFLAGALMGSSGTALGPSFAFLADENPALEQKVWLLDQESYQDVQRQLEPTSGPNSKSDWTVHAALALARWGNSDLDGALQSFRTAFQQNPDRSEFYFYYGRALLAKGETTMAAEQFQNAAKYVPKLPVAERYARLMQAAYTPPQLVSAAFSIIILLLLFTVHEFGHVYAAWKLGDDTAKNLGRLTLSPIAHLDLFGSILLPGIMLFQGSDYVFGWAKPTPVNPANFKNPRRDHMIVSFAGPAVNLLVAMACFLILGGIALALRIFWPETLTWHFATPWGATAISGPSFSPALTIAVIFIKQLMYMSLILGFFNLLPIPPLDGSWILSGILPEGMRNFYNGVGRRIGSLLFIILVFTPIMSYYVDIPVVGAWRGLYYLISSVGLG